MRPSLPAGGSGDEGRLACYWSCHANPPYLTVLPAPALACMPSRRTRLAARKVKGRHLTEVIHAPVAPPALT
jgi:hypothetical protein